MKRIAILLTCFNRKAKTLACLRSLFNSECPDGYVIEVHLVDDNSRDGTGEDVIKEFPQVNVINGTGSLFWAGGMSLAWQKARQVGAYDAYILLNDDVVLYPFSIKILIETHRFSLENFEKAGIYVGSTEDPVSKEITYGGHTIFRNDVLMRSRLVLPGLTPRQCTFTNANILWVSKEVVDLIGIFDEKFIHGIADYDYSYTAYKEKFPILVTPGILGACVNDHGNNWKSANTPLRERIRYLKSHTGLGYREYLYYIRKNFPLFYPYSFFMLWMKTFFPFFWDRLKERTAVEDIRE